MSHPTLNLSSDEEKRWENIKCLRVADPSREGRSLGFFWKKALEAFDNGDLVCSIVLAGITAELAHKIKLRRQGAEMKYRNSTPKSWGKLINQYEKDDEIKKKTKKIKDDYRNVWIHVDLKELDDFLKKRAVPSGPTLN